MAPLVGRIVKREFDERGLRITGLVVESETGEREFTNVEAQQSLVDDNVDMADAGWITQGLQVLLHEGVNITGEIQLCGASGRVTMLESVQVAGAERPSATPATSADDLRKSTDSSGGRVAVAMQSEGGTFVVPVQINEALTLDFTVDSGAADVMIPADVVMTLTRTGTLTENDFLKEKTYSLADGSTIPSRQFVLRSLRVGDKIVHDVTGSVAPIQGSLLLGQSFLSRFSSWSIDNKKHVLILE